MPESRLTRLGFLRLIAGLGAVGLGLSGCDSGAKSGPVVVEKPEDLAKREDTIKELYKTKSSSPTKTPR